MSIRLLSILLLAMAICATVNAGEIDGLVVITHRLTKKKITLSAAEYQRGTAVPLGSNQEDEDSLSYERSHVVVYLEDDGASQTRTATMEQKDRRFVPDLVVIPSGSTVNFPNLDPIFHNVFSLSRTKSFDLGNYPRGKARAVKFSKPGIVLVNCHLHTNMAAVIVVAPGPWAARVEGDGRFTLRGVPPGRHTLVAWHKAAGFFHQTIEVTEAQPAKAEFVIPLKADPVAGRQALLKR
jgi:plastocyanin